MGDVTERKTEEGSTAKEAVEETAATQEGKDTSGTKEGNEPTTAEKELPPAPESGGPVAAETGGPVAAETEGPEAEGETGEELKGEALEKNIWDDDDDDDEDDLFALAAIEEGAESPDEMDGDIESDAEEQVQEPPVTLEGEEHSGHEEDEEGLEDDAGMPPAQEEIPIEIPDLYEFMESLSELEDTHRKKPKPVADVHVEKRKQIVEEMGAEEESEEDMGDEGEKKEVESIGSDAEMYMLMDQVEDKPKVPVKEVEKEITIYEASGVKDLIENMIVSTIESVEKGEVIDHDAILRIKLDRGKLIRAFKISVTEIIEENKKRNLYHKKVVDYFRRKKYQRAFLEEKVETIPDSMKRYKNSLMFLDKALAREKALQDQLKKKIEDLSKIEDDLMLEVVKKTEQLNRRLKEVALSTVSIKTGQPMSEKFVDAIIRKMNFLRTQISELRLAFIKAQHRIAVLQNEARKLEDIGDGLKMIDYEALRAETQGLGDKVEERNNELSKIRDRCNSETHLLSHIREKQFMLNRVIMMHEHTLDGLKQELNENRSYLNQLKLERDSVRKKHTEMSYNCGILDKTNLLYDYDATVDTVKKAEARLEKLKQNKKKLKEQLLVITDKIEKY